MTYTVLMGLHPGPTAEKRCSSLKECFQSIADAFPLSESFNHFCIRAEEPGGAVTTVMTFDEKGTLAADEVRDAVQMFVERLAV